MFKNRWMIVASATSYDDEACRRASEIWTRENINEPSNRFRTKGAALVEIARNHDRIWGSLLHFRIVRVKDFYEGWR